MSAVVPSLTVGGFRRARWAAAATGAALATVGGALAVAGPRATAVPTVPCLFHAVTGWWCPLCGLTRGTRLLLHGDLAGAVGMHPLTPLVVLAIAACWVAWARTAWADRPPGDSVVLRSAAAVLNHRATWVLAAAFAVARNLPWGRALAP